MGKIQKMKIDIALQRAGENYRAGDLVECATITDQILEYDPFNFDALTLKGIVAGQSNRIEEAAKYLKLALKVQPENPYAKNNYANALKANGEIQQAIRLYREILENFPSYIDAKYNYVVALREFGKSEHAIEACRELLRHEPENSAFQIEMAFILANKGDTEAAIWQMESTVQPNPEHLYAYFDLAKILETKKLFIEAIKCYEIISQKLPNSLDALNGKGSCLLRLARDEEAVDVFIKATNINPKIGATWNNLGVALNKAGRYAEAIKTFNESIAVDPNSSEAYNNRGSLFASIGAYEIAKKDFDTALSLRPKNIDALFNKARISSTLGQHIDALKTIEEAISLNPDGKYFQGVRMYSKLSICDWEGYEINLRTLKKAVQKGSLVSPPFEAAAIFDEILILKKLGERKARENYVAPNKYSNSSYSKIANINKLRIGFISADFRQHAMGYNFRGFFERIDKEKFEIIAISLLELKDNSFQNEFRRIFDGFYDVDRMANSDLIQFIKNLSLDICVDMMGDTALSRQYLFSTRLASIHINQFSWVSEPGLYDYMISDFTVTPDKYRELYSEKIVRIPGTLFAYDDKRKRPLSIPTRESLDLPDGKFIFCAFNNSFKLNPKIYSVWMRILIRLPNSVLWLRSFNSIANENLRQEASKRGVSPDRIYFAPVVENHEDHISRQSVANVFLDTMPFNAQTTAVDALVAGLPIITTPGETPMSRIAASILTAAELPELITNNLKEYEDLAVALALDFAKLKQFKEKIDHSYVNSRFFNTSYYTNMIENAYIEMYHRHSLGAPPIHFDIPDK